MSRENYLLVRSVFWINFRDRTFVFGNRTVTVSLVPLLEGGNAVRFFHSVFFASGSASFVVFLPFFFSEGRCLKKFSGANFCFWVSVWVLRVLVLFCLCFCFIICFFAPETVLKNSLDVRSGVFGLSSFFLGCFADVVVFLSSFFLRETAQVVTGHTPTRTLCFFFSFSFLCPRRIRVYRPFWPCVPSCWRFVGVPFWAPGVFWILSGLLWGLFLGREAARVLLCFLCLCCFSPFRFVLRLHTFSRSPSRLSSRSGQPE